MAAEQQRLRASGDSPITNAQRLTGIVTVLVLGLFALTGCAIGDVSGAAPATPTPQLESHGFAPDGTGTGVPSSLESSLVLIRPAGDASKVLGTAVVMRTDGLLVTSIELGTASIEAVMPDGEVYRPVLVATEPAAGIALLKIPVDRAVPVQVSTKRISSGAEVFVAGYDDSSGLLGRMGGTALEVETDSDTVDYRVRGPFTVETDITFMSGFVGGALTDDSDRFAGVLLPGESDDGRKTLRAVSNWFVVGWLDSLVERQDRIQAESGSWERIELPGGWSVAQPDNWTLAIETDNDERFRAELTPPDPDAAMRISISVEPNSYGTDPEEFLTEVFSDRSNARLWGVERAHNRSLVRLAMDQEGALVDVGYVLDHDLLIAVSLTSAFRPDDDPAQADQARAIYEAVLTSMSRD